MSDFLSRLFRLRPEEVGLALVMGGLILGNSLARQITGIVAVSGLLSVSGVNAFLLVLLVDYLIILLAGGVQSLIVDRLNRKNLMGGVIVAFVLVFVVVRLLFALRVPAQFNYIVLYLVAEQQLIFFPLVFWVLGNDIFDMAQAKRLFPFIASWGFIGKILGSGFSAAMPTLFARLGRPAEDVLWLNVLIYGLAYAGLLIGLRHIKVRPANADHESVRETLSEGWGFVKEVPSFRYLMMAIVALALCDTLIEFRFLGVTNSAFPSRTSYQQFYSLYRLGVTVAAFLVQSLLTSRLIEKMNLKNTFFVFPAVVLAGVAGLLVFPELVTAVAAMATVKLVRETLDESSRKAFQALVPEERRGRVSTFMDSYLPAIGTILACVLAGAVVLAGLYLPPALATAIYVGVGLVAALAAIWTLLEQWTALATIGVCVLAGGLVLAGWRIGAAQTFYVYLGLAGLGGGLALWATVKMRRAYDGSLLNWRLKRRQRASRVLDKLEF